MDLIWIDIIMDEEVVCYVFICLFTNMESLDEGLASMTCQHEAIPLGLGDSTNISEYWNSITIVCRLSDNN